MMRAGSLDRRVEILRQTETGVDPLYNTPVKSDWLPVLSFWAQKIHNSEDEKQASMTLYAERIVTFKARWQTGVLETDRLLSEGQTYEIKGIREIGRRTGLEIKCQAYIGVEE